MVKKKLDTTFEKINREANGLEWYVVPGHYWLELRIYPLKKKNDKPLFESENAPVAVKSFLDGSRMIQSKLSNVSKAKNSRPHAPVYNNIIRDESEKPDIFSNPLSSVNND